MFSKHQAYVQWIDAPIHWAAEPKSLQADINLFLERVDEHRFALETGWLIEGTDDALHLLQTPPIDYHGLDYHYVDSSQIEAYREPLRTLIYLEVQEIQAQTAFLEADDQMDEESLHYDEESGTYLIGYLPGDIALPRTIDLRQLAVLLRDTPAPYPLNILPDLIDWLQASTGNLFLDTSAADAAEGYAEACWEDWQILTAQWQPAKEIYTRFTELLDWIHPSFKDAEGHPERLEALLTMIREVWHGRAVDVTPPPQTLMTLFQ